MRQCLANVQLFLSDTEPQLYCRDTVEPRYRRLLYKWRRAEKPNFNLTTDNFSVKFVYNINIMGDKLLLNFWREIS